ncbi:MAG: sigma-70 family RNA polymerase sigma factor [Flavobacteriaceae bacterium]|nr:sigma-70 family RNA polymerase sigma factor [Flavobacteriaceae bacterium]
MDQPDELILEMQNGNHAALSKIYDMYSKAIYGIVISFVRNHSIAEEVLQDVFVKVWNNSGSYNPTKGRFYTWLLNIARNTAIDVTRSKAFKNSTKNLTTENFVDILAGHDNLSGKTDAIGIKKYITALKPVCIQIIELLYFKGYTQAETAETLETPLGTIKTRARNCISELRKILLNK